MEEKKKKRLGPTHSMLMKALAFILCILMLCVTAVSVVGVVLMFQAGVYWNAEETVKGELFETYAYDREYGILNRYRSGEHYRIENYLNNTNICYVMVESADSSLCNPPTPENPARNLTRPAWN